MSETLLATFRLDAMTLGIDIQAVREVLRDQQVQPAPRAGRGVLGTVNLRGRVLAVTDVRSMLGLPVRDGREPAFYVVETELGEDILRVDVAGDVLSVDAATMMPVPETTPAAIAQYLSGAYEVEGHLLLVVDLNRLLNPT